MNRTTTRLPTRQDDETLLLSLRLHDAGMPSREIAERVGKTPSWVRASVHHVAVDLARSEARS